MATLNKNFKIKHGLIVEGTTGTINNFDILTKSTDDQNYIIDLVGGDASSNAVANTLVLRDANANFLANTITADLVGDVTGQVSDISNHDSDDVSEGSTNLYFTDQRAEDAMAGLYDPAGSAANAYSNATAYTDLEIGNAYADLEDYADFAAGNALGNANSYTDNAIGLLSTTDIEEGTNEYFTDLRAKTSTADLLTNATLINLSITGNATAGLTIEAENGVGDSNTDALVEGSTNLYFTDQRAVDALEAVIPNFTEIDINDVARQVAATVNAPTASTVTAIDWALAEYRSAEFLVKVAYGAHTEISKVMLTLDTSNNIAITEYAIVGTNGSASTISADVNGTDVRLRVATANNNSDVTVVGTLLV